MTTNRDLRRMQINKPDLDLSSFKLTQHASRRSTMKFDCMQSPHELILAIHEPATSNGKVTGFGLGVTLVYDKPKTGAAIIGFNKEISIMKMTEFCEVDISCAELTGSFGTLILVSLYCKYNRKTRLFIRKLKKIVDARANREIVICVDLNARSPMWGASSTNENEEKFEQFLAESDKVETLKGDARFCVERANWEKYTESLLESKVNIRATITEHAVDVNKIADAISGSIVEACNDAIPTSTGKYKQQAWWTSSLRIAKKKIERLRSLYVASMTEGRKAFSIEQLRNNYQIQRKLYQKEIRTTKKKSWEKFVTKVSGQNVWGLPYKIATGKVKQRKPLLSLRRQDGSMTESWSQTAKALLDALVPDDSPRRDDRPQQRLRAKADARSNGEDAADFTCREVWNAMQRNTSGKSPGADLVIPEALKNALIILPEITDLFNKCLASGKIPSAWKKGVVVPILKPEKDEALAKSYRPICLLSLIGKTFEKKVLANDTAAKKREDARLLDEWQTRWDRSSTGRTTHEFFPSIARRLKYSIELDYYVTQFLTDHGGFAYYLHTFNAKNFTRDSDECDCGQTETADHILFECPLIRRMRRSLVKAAVEITGSWPCATENLVSDKRIFKEFKSSENGTSSGHTGKDTGSCSTPTASGVIGDRSRNARETRIHRSATCRLACDSRCRWPRPLARGRCVMPGVAVVHFSLVGRRDPLGVGQRPGRLTVAQLSRVLAPRTAGVSRPDCPTVEIFVNKVLGRVLSASRLVDRLASLGFTDLVPLPGAWLAVKSAMSSDWLLDYLSATLLLWVLLGSVLKHGPRSLTRTRVTGNFSRNSLA
ncbi:unnamed protein product [Trichogramma brassicae]|uniref:Endonuclease/exonuclease/phosphatase domain-containing protein n=1 Tax=Trichogramma brassicae TaxID=86971 RepID=A0A6H5I8R8_9HYME|nr:unnamed protein product [Trichogramma brassicae]